MTLTFSLAVDCISSPSRKAVHHVQVQCSAAREVSAWGGVIWSIRAQDSPGQGSTSRPRDSTSFAWRVIAFMTV